MLTFDTYGPFPLAREGQFVSREAWNDFWDQIDQIELEEAIVVYVSEFHMVASGLREPRNGALLGMPARRGRKRAAHRRAGGCSNRR